MGTTVTTSYLFDFVNISARKYMLVPPALPPLFPAFSGWSRKPNHRLLNYPILCLQYRANELKRANHCAIFRPIVRPEPAFSDVFAMAGFNHLGSCSANVCNASFNVAWDAMILCSDEPAFSLSGFMGGCPGWRRRFRRMRQGMDRLQLADRHMRVDLRGTVIAVPQHRLDVAQLGAVFQHVRGHRMAQQVVRAGRCVFRSMWATGSGRCGPPIPSHVGHRFRAMWAGCDAVVGQYS